MTKKIRACNIKQLTDSGNCRSQKVDSLAPRYLIMAVSLHQTDNTEQSSHTAHIQQHIYFEIQCLLNENETAP